MTSQPSKPKYTIRQTAKGFIIAVRRVQDNGRIQIPKPIRSALNLNDGDDVYWMNDEGVYFIVKSTCVG